MAITHLHPVAWIYFIAAIWYTQTQDISPVDVVVQGVFYTNWWNICRNSSSAAALDNLKEEDMETKSSSVALGSNKHLARGPSDDLLLWVE